MGVWLNAAFARAPLDEVKAGLEHVLTLRGHRPGRAAAHELQHARAASSPHWTLGGFAGGADWTVILAAPFDVLTHDGGALVAELSRALASEVWQLDLEDGDSARVFRAADGQLSRAGFLTRELDDGMAFDPMLLVPILSDVDVASACNAAHKRAPRAAVTVMSDGGARKVHPADLVRSLAQTDCPDLQAVATAIADVFGGAHAAHVTNRTTLEFLAAGKLPPVVPSFGLWTHVEN